MPSRSGLREHQEIMGQIAPAIHETRNAPYEVTHAQYTAYMRPVHDLGGEFDLPVRYEEKEEEQQQGRPGRLDQQGELRDRHEPF